MNRKLVSYAAILAVLAIGLKLMEYRMLARDHKTELYIGIIALLFAVLGIIAGKKLTRPKEIVINKTIEVHVPTPSSNTKDPVDDARLEALGISKREFEILQLMAEGLSNQEIAERSFVSINTVKTHVSNLLLKLDAKRRTQAITKARELNLVP